MAGDTLVCIVGNLTADPELRFVSSGAAVASFTIATTPSSFDKASNSWKDGEALFMRCSLWKTAAENAAESLTRGTRVIAQGYLKQRSYETKEGEKRTVVELDVQEIGASLKFATVTAHRAERGSSTSSNSSSQATSDPWGAPAPGTTADDPPFARAREAWETGSGIAI